MLARSRVRPATNERESRSATIFLSFEFAGTRVRLDHPSRWGINRRGASAVRNPQISEIPPGPISWTWAEPREQQDSKVVQLRLGGPKYALIGTTARAYARSARSEMGGWRSEQDGQPGREIYPKRIVGCPLEAGRAEGKIPDSGDTAAR